MSRYIDADELMKELKEEIYFETPMYTEEQNKYFNLGLRCAIRDVKAQPAADVVEVVRKSVKGYEGYYEVDQFGRVYSVDRVVYVEDDDRKYNKALVGRQMKQHTHSKGYKIVFLTKDGKTKTVFVHRIVAEAFIENPQGLPFVNHKDEDKTNNFAENLEWCTASYNRTYGRSVEKQAKRLSGRKHTEEHKRKISEGVKRYYGERIEEE